MNYLPENEHCFDPLILNAFFENPLGLRFLLLHLVRYGLRQAREYKKCEVYKRTYLEGLKDALAMSVTYENGLPALSLRRRTRHQNQNDGGNQCHESDGGDIVNQKKLKDHDRRRMKSVEEFLMKSVSSKELHGDEYPLEGGVKDPEEGEEEEGEEALLKRKTGIDPDPIEEWIRISEKTYGSPEIERYNNDGANGRACISPGQISDNYYGAIMFRSGLT